MPGQYRALQGFKDILPGEQPYWRFVENRGRFTVPRVGCPHFFSPFPRKDGDLMR